MKILLLGNAISITPETDEERQELMKFDSSTKGLLWESWWDESDDEFRINEICPHCLDSVEIQRYLDYFKQDD